MSINKYITKDRQRRSFLDDIFLLYAMINLNTVNIRNAAPRSVRGMPVVRSPSYQDLIPKNRSKPTIAAIITSDTMTRAILAPFDIFFVLSEPVITSIPLSVIRSIIHSIINSNIISIDVLLRFRIFICFGGEIFVLRSSQNVFKGITRSHERSEKYGEPSKPDTLYFRMLRFMVSTRSA